MALTYSSASLPGSFAPDFKLRGIAAGIERDWSLSDFRDRKVLVIVFMCNHCPYVIAVQDRINRLALDYAARSVALIGINSNDSVKYPADSFEAMKTRSRDQAFAFPYLRDESQAVARAYDAVCTPDPYVYENTARGFVLRYRGRLDDSWKDAKAVKSSDVACAIDTILAGRQPGPEQIPSMGCSIKWLPS